MFGTSKSPNQWRTGAFVLVATLSLLGVIALVSPGSSVQSAGAEASAVEMPEAALAPSLSWSPIPSSTVSPNRGSSLGAAIVSTPTWLDGPLEVTEDKNCFGDNLAPIISDFVGYYGTADHTSPKVGEVYYVRVAVGDLGGTCGSLFVNVNMVLPPDTKLAINRTNKVYCSTAAVGNWDFVDVPAGDCPQRIFEGPSGWVFNRASGAPWDLSGGRMIIVAAPVISTKKMSGSATNSWLQGALQAFNNQRNPYGSPSQAVFVAENSPTVTYPMTSTTKIKTTTARTTALVSHHYVGGKVYFDIGTSTRYGDQGQTITIKDDANAYSVYQDWSGLEPNTTYHWRARFVANGKTYTGADQMFKTLSR